MPPFNLVVSMCLPVVVLCLVMLGYTIDNGINQSNNLSHLVPVKQQIQQDLQNTKRLSYKEYKHKLKHNQFVD